MMITVDEWRKVDIRIGKVIAVERIAKPGGGLRKLEVDFGPEIGVRAAVVKTGEDYSEEDLSMRMVVGVVNIGEKLVAGVRSEVLILGVHAENGALVLLLPGRSAEIGGRVF